MHERISLVTMIFSDKNQAKMVSNLSGKDAQTFVDKVNEVRSHNPSFEAVAPWLKLLIFSIRRWTIWHHRCTGDVCAICIESAVVRPYFRGLWKFHFVTIQRGTLLFTADIQTCGRVSMKAGRSQFMFIRYYQVMTARRSRE